MIINNLTEEARIGNNRNVYKARLITSLSVNNILIGKRANDRKAFFTRRLSNIVD